MRLINMNQEGKSSLRQENMLILFVKAWYSASTQFNDTRLNWIMGRKLEKVHDIGFIILKKISFLLQDTDNKCALAKSE